MINKFVMTKAKNVSFVKGNLPYYLYHAMKLARYDVKEDEVKEWMENNPLETEAQIALNNFMEAFTYIMDDHETDYLCLITLHQILMKGLNENISSSLTNEQISELNLMVNQPTKANTEVAIDVMLYILDKRLFSDGDVRVAIMFANKMMIEKGNGIICIAERNDKEFRERLKAFHEGDRDFKEWIYKTSIAGKRFDY